MYAASPAHDSPAFVTAYVRPRDNKYSLLRMGELEAFYARRRRVTFVISLGRRVQPLLLRRGGPELRELPARRDDGMARAPRRCRGASRGARLNTTPSPYPTLVYTPTTHIPRNA